MSSSSQKQSQRYTPTIVSRPTLYGLSLLAKRDPRIKEEIAQLGLELLEVVRDGRMAFLSGDREQLAEVCARYLEIRGERGQPRAIDEYVRVRETQRSNWLERKAVADIILRSAPHLALEEETILRYMRQHSRKQVLSNRPNGFAMTLGNFDDHHPMSLRLPELVLATLAKSSDMDVKSQAQRLMAEHLISFRYL
jgi:hypothetical protein